jgi:hypothetical protein
MVAEYPHLWTRVTDRHAEVWRLAVLLAVTGTCLGLSGSLPSEGALGAPRTFVLHGISLSIIEVDLGARFGCPDPYIGLVL